MNFKFVVTLLTGLVECICFAGVTFGWASLVFVLKKEKYFQDLCPDTANHTTNSTDSCFPQDERYSLIFTVAAFMNNLMTLPSGYIFDRFGTMVTRFIGISCYTTATLFIALSTPDTGLLLFPALSLLATGGIIFILTNMQVGNLFGGQRSTIITFYNGAFDSSSVIFLIVKVLYQNGISLRTLFLFLSCCSAIHILRTLFLLPKGHIPYPLPEGYHYGIKCEKDVPEKKKTLGSSELPNDGQKSKEAKDCVGEPFLKSPIKQGEQPEITIWNCVFSSLFGWHLVWLSFMQLRHYLFIGTLNPTITHLSGGDLHTVSTYTNVFAVFQFCGVLCAPWNGLIMDRHKRKNKDTGKHDDLHSSILSLTLTAIQCILFSVCASIPLLPVLYPTFFLQVLNRSFLYGGNAAFLSIAFPAKHFGKLYGLVMSLSAVISLLQYPAFYIIRTHLNKDPLYVNIFLAILMLVTFAHPINILRICREDRKARKAADSHTS
ncbi:equilibrative nucleobase transporter 1 isoform X2 [Pyxicephalus adspersus]|uniref:equilibrative nucleobase transporter 1 isoform X2 n=1 Tax=Pyxicephalus adspersus TaxID=30357 RepID=UPI003B593C32